MSTNPLTVMRTRSYLVMLVVAVALGVPIAAVAYWFLKLIDLVQHWVYSDLPQAVGFDGQPTWWPVLPLAVAGLIVGLTIRFLPGRGGKSPADGFHGSDVPQPVTLPGIALAAVATIGLGAALGPEMPLIALGGGLAFLAVSSIKRDISPRAGTVIAATGSFAAISTLLGTPLTGAFLLLEASSVGGTTATVVLLPGLLGAGVGALIFTGLNSLTGYGTFSLAIPSLPAVSSPTVAEFGWAVAIGLAAAPLGVGLRWAAVSVRDRIGRQIVPATTVLGVVIAAIAIGYAEWTGHQTSDVLFSGQSALPDLIKNSADYSLGALVLLVLCKSLAYAASLSAFRGGPVFPAMFIGAAGGLALSHLPGLPTIAATAMGIGAVSAVMLRLPMTAVLLTTLLLGSDGFPVMPLTIVTVVVAYIAANWLTPAAQAEDKGATAGPRPPATQAPSPPPPHGDGRTRARPVPGG